MPALVRAGVCACPERVVTAYEGDRAGPGNTPARASAGVAARHRYHARRLGAGTRAVGGRLCRRRGRHDAAAAAPRRPAGFAPGGPGRVARGGVMTKRRTFRDAVVVITGASSGVGRATAL